MTKTPKFRFGDDAPPLGFQLWDKGHAYDLTKAEPYLTKEDGRATWLLSWRGVCATCGAAHHFTTGAAIYGMRRRCDECRPAKGNGGAVRPYKGA